MPIRGAEIFDEVRSLLRAPTAALGPEMWMDAHTHIGQNDPDGTKGTMDEILAGLDAAGHARALVFPMHEPAGYGPANDMVADAVAGSGGRLERLARVDPGAPGAVDELRRCLAAGARGLKLHPRSDSFGLPHPVVDELVAVCAEDRRPVLFHAGRGIPALGAGAVALARRHPGTPIILAHAGISDLGTLASAAADTPNLYFDTSWWMVADMLQLLATVPPGQVLYASDMPYGPGLYTAFLVARCVAHVGLSSEAFASIAGAQLRRLLDGEGPLALGPPPGLDAVGSRDTRCERVVLHASAALQTAYKGGEPAETVALARLGCQHEDVDDPKGELLDVCDALLARASVARARAGDQPLAMVPLAMVAQAIAGTHQVPVDNARSVGGVTDPSG